MDRIVEILFSDTSWQLMNVAFILFFFALVMPWRLARQIIFVLSAGIGMLAAALQFRESFEVLLFVSSILIAGLVLLCAVGLKERYNKVKARSRLASGAVYLGLSLQLVFVLIAEGSSNPAFNSALNSVVYLFFIVFGVVQLIATIVRSRTVLTAEKPLGNEPTLTLAVPARNETHALTQSLDTLIDSSYSKLEVLVLDDCSSDKTPEIIKSFARGGVRFVGGEMVPDGWLGKNFAYQQLLRHASGEYIAFSGVDVHFAPTALSSAIAYMQQNNLTMVSIAPQRLHGDFFSNILQLVRYFTQLCLPRSTSALSSVWIIKREYLRTNGGFEQIKSLMEPERAVAQSLPKHSYRFVSASGGLVSTRKHLSSQYETALRLLYPSLGSSIFTVLLMVIFGVLAVSMMINYATTLPLLILAALVIYYTSFAIASQHLLRGTHAIVSVVIMPLALLLQLVVAVLSMVKYEFGFVGWKERNVCIPVLSQKSKLDR